MVDLLDKDFKTTVKDVQRTKRGCGESWENDVRKKPEISAKK